MKEIGIRRVYYSINDNIICENVKDMVSIESSSVTKLLERQLHRAPISDYDYFVDLLRKKLPHSIKRKNLMFFLEHNLSNVLPQCSWYEKKIKGSFNIVIIGNDGVILSCAEII